MVKQMAKNNIKSDREKIAINENTYQTLKNFSRLHGLKLRVVIDAMTEIILSDEALTNQLINKAIDTSSSKPTNA